MFAFADLAQVQAVLDGLATRPLPLVVKLPRQPGTKENRFAHLLCGPPPPATEEESAGPVEPVRLAVQADNERIAKLEAEVAALRAELSELGRQFAEFKKAFE